jgi:hypothetical protein
MKEIDFLPEWYKSGKRRESRYRTQYLVIGCLFAVMVAWNFASVHTLSRVEAVLVEQSRRQAESTDLSVAYASVKGEVLSFRDKANQIERLDSHIDLVSVLGELSYLLDGNIVLSEVELASEKFVKKNEKGKGGSVVRAAGNGLVKPTAGGAVRFKVVIKGVASDGMEASAFVRKLEQSPYFRDVTSWLRNKEISNGSDDSGSRFAVSEFEIVCYLANYKEHSAGSVNAYQGILSGS